MDGGVRPNGGGLRMDITLGNIISWAVMVATMGVVYGTMASTVNSNTHNNERQDMIIQTVQDAITDLKVAIATGNGDVKLMRQSVERIERTQTEALRAAAGHINNGNHR